MCIFLNGVTFQFLCDVGGHLTDEFMDKAILMKTQFFSVMVLISVRKELGKQMSVQRL